MDLATQPSCVQHSTTPASIDGCRSFLQVQERNKVLHLWTLLQYGLNLSLSLSLTKIQGCNTPSSDQLPLNIHTYCHNAGHFTSIREWKMEPKLSVSFVIPFLSTSEFHPMSCSYRDNTKRPIFMQKNKTWKTCVLAVSTLNTENNTTQHQQIIC